MRLVGRLATAVIMMAATAAGGEFKANGCRVKWDERTLEVGNSSFSRRYAVAGGVLKTLSLSASGGGEWQRIAAGEGEREKISVAAEKAKWSPVGVEGLKVTVSMSGGVTTLHLFPGVPGVLAVRPTRPPIESFHDLERDISKLSEIISSLGRSMGASDTLYFPARHIKATSILCIDQTDIRDNLVEVNERMLMDYDVAYSLSTSIMDFRDILTGDGVVFVRLAPMPVSRPVKADDFVVSGSSRAVALVANGYPLAELAYRGGEAGRRRALVAFQRALRPYRPGRDGVLLSNTWGAGNRDSRICEEFLLKEIEAGAKIGVDVIQIDDGWQHGGTANSRKAANAGRKKVWNGYWAADPDFWREDRERFPGGLKLLVDRAAAKGMRFGIWFGPDSSDDAANWKRDAECLLDYHRRLGIDYFKIDSMKVHTPLALERNRKMFDMMLEQSGGDMVFDLDCTAEVRPGFFGLIDIGPLFVENRYTLKPVYWPHHTLKNLWDLSHVIDSVRLRFEFNNPDTNHANYRGSPLGHGNYRPDALFATVMAASPLAWMELSDVSERSVEALAGIIAKWKRERDRWYSGVIHPVGERPDGVNWTGFVSESPDGGYALIFREFNPVSEREFDLRPIFGAAGFSQPEVVAGYGSAEIAEGRLKVSITEKLGYLWVRFSKNSAPRR